MKKRYLGISLLIIVLIFTSACGKEEKKEQPEKFELKYNNIAFELGGLFTKDKYGEELDYAEMQSCAFDGLDKTYTYEHYEIATYPKEDKDYISSIYFLDPEITTTEGLAIDDSKDKMIEVYGKDYKEEDGRYIYTKGKTQLIFIIQNDKITSIEYIYIT